MAQVQVQELKLEKDYAEGVVRVLQNGDVVEEVSIRDLPEDIQLRLAVYGAYVKLQRSTAGKKPEEHSDAVLKTVEALRQGRWTVGTFGPRVSKKQAILQMIKETDPSIREQFVQALRVSGQLERAGITEEEVQEVLSA